MRIVCLCPSLTESLVALGAGPDLVGVTRYCVHPKGALEGIARVGGTKNPDLAAIGALAPDLVFCNAEENRPADVAALAREHAVDVSHPRRPADVPALLRHVGRRVGRPVAGESWALMVEEAVAAAQARTAAPFRFLCLVWKEPWMAAGPATYLSGLLELAGGENVLAGRGLPDYPALSEDEVVAAAPDALVLPDEPYPFGEEHRRQWSSRLPGSVVVSAPGDDLTWHGVRTLRGIEAAVAIADRVRPSRPPG